MISQTLFFLGLHLLGLCVGVAIGPARRPHLVASLAFTAGLAVMVALELLLLVVHIRFTALSGGVAALVLAALCLLVARRRGWPARAERGVLAAWTVGFVIVAAALSWRNLAVMSYDSHFIVMLGGIIAHDGAFVPGLLEKMGFYGAFEALAQGLVCFTDRTFLYALAPVFAASTAAFFGVALDTALAALAAPARHRRWLVALVTAATFSGYMLFRHTFYIHTNFGTATYLLAFCALVFLADVEDDPSFVPLAFLSLFALSLHRTEAPLVCALFVALTILPGKLPARRVLPSFALYTAASAGWYLLLGSAVSPTSPLLTPKRCLLLAAISVVILVYYALSSLAAFGWLRRVSRFAPHLAAATMVLGLVVTFTLRPEHMSLSARIWKHSIFYANFWMGPFQVMLLLAVLGLFAPAPPARWAFVVGVPAYAALILLLVYSRTPYNDTIHDSAARMALHLVPLAFFYFGLKFVPLVRWPGQLDAQLRPEVTS
jgi:hypothetical protein